MTVDTQRLRERLDAYGMHRSTSIRMEIISAVPALLDEIERLTQQNGGLMEQHGRDSQELRRLCEDRDQARRTAQYWKDQHLAGNAEIERKDAEIARLRAQLEYTDRYAMDSIRTASRDLDDWHGDMLHLSNSARAALSPNPGDPTPTGVSE